MSNIFKRAGDKISSLSFFKKFRFDWEYYSTLGPYQKYDYLGENRNKLSNKKYAELSTTVIMEMRELENKETERKWKEQIRVERKNKLKSESNTDSELWYWDTGYRGNMAPSSSKGLYHHLKSMSPNVKNNTNMKMKTFEQLEMIKQMFKDEKYRPNRKMKFDIESVQGNDIMSGFKEKQDLQTVDIVMEDNNIVSIPIYDESDIIDIEQYVFNDAKQWEYYRQAREQKLQRLGRQKQIDEMNEGCILVITNTGAAITPLVDQLNPTQFRYRMIINRLNGTVDFEDTFKCIFEMFPFIEKNQITKTNKVEEYFPLDLTKDYGSRFAAKWLFVKNVSEESVLIYLRFPQDPAYNDRSFVSVKPGGIISLLYGNMINCKQYHSDIRVSDDHEFMKQYNEKTHPLIKDATWE